MFPRPLLPVGSLAIAVGALSYLWLADTRAPGAAPAGAAVPAEAKVTPANAEAPALRSPLAAATPASPLQPRAARRAEIDRKRERIRERLEQREVDDARPVPRAETDPGPAELDKEYIRESVHELIPVIRDCYDSALQDDEALGGKLVMTFEILGDEEVGGVVDHVEVDPEQSTIHDAELRECVRESMYTLELPAPSAGGSVMVTYPFVFSAT